MINNIVAESGVYDVTVNNDNTKFASLSALLSSENIDTLIPSDKRKGGMSIKFVQSSDNKYVQYRLMVISFSTAESDWEEIVSVKTATNNAESDLDIADESGNVLARFKNGHFKVKNFDSADTLDSIQAILSNIGFDNIPEFNEEEDYTIGDIVKYGKLVYVFTSAHEAGDWDASEVEETVINTERSIDVTNSSSEADLEISDEQGNVLLRCVNGHIKVKYFNSADNNESLSAILNNIGFNDIPEFDEEDDYAVDDVVRYGKYIYKFIAVHSGEWDSEDVEIANIFSNVNIDSPIDVKNASSNEDLDISDESGNVLARFSSGHFKVKNFDSRNINVKIGGVNIVKHFIDLKEKKIMLYGDSISSSDYSFYKDSLEEITNATVYNGGFSGYSTAQLASATCLSRAINYNPDVVLILVGGNDMGNFGTIGTFGTYGGLLASEPVVSIPDISSAYSGSKYIEAVAYITQYLTYHIGGFRHNAYLVGDCTDVGFQLSAETDLDETTKPIVILCTTLPQQRNDSSSDWSSHENSKRKADACREVAELLNIPLLDFATRAGFAEINETYWQSPTDKVHNKGTYMMDGLHPNKYGYRRMARLVYDFLTPYFIN